VNHPLSLYREVPRKHRFVIPFPGGRGDGLGETTIPSPPRGGEMVWAKLLSPLPLGERACPVK